MIGVRAAEAQGLTFTGHYESWYDREKIKTIAAAIRKLYNCRAVLVSESGGGVSIYADDRYQAMQNAGRLASIIVREADEQARLKAEYDKKVAELTERTDKAKAQFAEYCAQYPEFKTLTTEPNVYEYMSANGIKY